jgi:methylmalonyl-CoA mutase N-terminal domain/subunit
MFKKKVLDEARAMEKRWRVRCAGCYGEKMTKGGATRSGMPLKPVYSPTDIEGIDYNEISLPGEYPYTRGLNPLQYQVNSWMLRWIYGYGTAEDSRKRRDFLEKVGMREHIGETSLAVVNIVGDLPTQRGLDPDDPRAQGRVGECGVSISTMRDFKKFFEGLPLDKLRTTFICDDPTMVLLAMYIVYAERRGYSPEQLNLTTINRLYRQPSWDIISWGPESAFKLMVEDIYYCCKNIPRAGALNLSGYLFAEAGANAIQELAFVLSVAIEVTKECIRAGLDPDEFVPRFYTHMHFGMDLFEEIVKIRALRRMWAKLFKERFGCKKSESLQVRTPSGQTAGIDLTAQEPLNNIIRATIMTLGSILAGVDGVCTSSYDEALNIPSEEAVKLSVRTNQILYHETNIPCVSDPLGGSYYIEWLTSKIEEEAWKLIERIEELGGYKKCWESGWLRREMERSAKECQDKIESGEKIIVGVNKYAEEQAGAGVERTFEVDAQTEEKAMESLRKFRAERDVSMVKQSLDKLREVARRFIADWPGSCGILMPALISAARVDATLGEMSGVLQEVCGIGYSY